jgi:hypothetical protein
MDILGSSKDWQDLTERKSMTITATWDDKPQAVEGIHICTILEVEDLGMVEDKHETHRKIRITFQMDDQKDCDGTHILLRDDYALKLSQNSKLRKLVEGMGYTSAHGEEFDVESLKGKSLQVVVRHDFNKMLSRTFANIESVIKSRRVQ